MDEQCRKEIFSDGAIVVGGAKENNLKNITVSIPRHSFTVVTGLSGSGKSTLVFDVLLAEGQRRYIETFSVYARNFLAYNKRPNVEYIHGLSPVVAIAQKTSSKGSRSTVGTTTEILDFLRLLFARTATPYSYATGNLMSRYNESELASLIGTDFHGSAIEILAPVVKNRKGHYKELLESFRKKGFLHVYVDGKIVELVPDLKLERYATHYVAVVIDKFVVRDDNASRILDSVKLALAQGDGLLDIRRRDTGEVRHLSSKYFDHESGIAYTEPTSATFSFNSPRGWCPKCRGTGVIDQLDVSKLILEPQKSLEDGAIPLLKKKALKSFYKSLEAFLKSRDYSLATKVGTLPTDILTAIVLGSPEDHFIGMQEYLLQEAENIGFLDEVNDLFSDYLTQEICPCCNGFRLSQESLSYKVAGYNIGTLCHMELSNFRDSMISIINKIDINSKKIASEIIKEICLRTDFLLDLGLDYLTLDRATNTLSGGEMQRIRLATQIGTGLVEVLYLLDEPGIGLHPRDNQKLLSSLHKLRDAGNTVVVVEHDRATMLAADYLIDLGPGAGRLGGEIVFAGPPSEVKKAHTITANYLNNIKKIEVPIVRRKGNGKHIQLIGAKGNNLKNVSVSLPLGSFICVTGVSGSGKSSLINDTLVPALSRILYRSKQVPLPYGSLLGDDNIDKLAVVDQSPIGRTPRSNPATYTGIFTEIRSIFVNLPESKSRGYSPGRFSFNVSGGRCEACKGNGYRTISMNLLPDVMVPCEVCHGKRYSRETLEVRFKGKSISDILEMTINQAAEFFQNIPKIKKKLDIMKKVGLGYIKLGQPSTTLSGGEAQRVKLSEELSKRDTGNSLFVLDEPTTGLHFEDIRLLLSIINELVDRGNTVIVIEHDMDVIKSADYIIEMGPEGGADGGELLFAGSPEEMIKNCQKGATRDFLKKEIYRSKNDRLE